MTHLKGKKEDDIKDLAGEETENDALPTFQRVPP